MNVLMVWVVLDFCFLIDFMGLCISFVEMVEIYLVCSSCLVREVLKVLLVRYYQIFGYVGLVWAMESSLWDYLVRNFIICAGDIGVCLSIFLGCYGSRGLLALYHVYIGGSSVLCVWVVWWVKGVLGGVGGWLRGYECYFICAVVFSESLSKEMIMRSLSDFLLIWFVLSLLHWS